MNPIHFLLRLIIRLVLTALLVLAAAYASFLFIWTAAYSEGFPDLGHFEA